MISNSQNAPKSHQQPPSKFYVRLLMAIFSIETMLGYGVYYGLTQANPSCGNGPATPIEISRSHGTRRSFGLPEFLLLEIEKTSLTDARAILPGRGTEISRDHKTVTYQWKNEDGSEIVLVFRDNMLVSKKQSGL